jgi:class 3 adenylate cyclase
MLTAAIGCSAADIWSNRLKARADPDAGTSGRPKDGEFLHLGGRHLRRQMDTIETPTPGEERSGWRLRLERLRLRFRDRGLESAYRADRFRHVLGNIRFAFLAGIALWVTWGLLLRPYMLALSDQRLDMVMRFGVFIPMLVVGLGLTYTRFFGRIWEWVSVAIAVATLLFWVFYVSRISTLPAEYGYVGVILITAFTYTLLQLRFVLVVLITVIGIAAYLPYALTARYIVDVSLVLATLYLVSFGLLGGLAAYRMERFTRDLFLRERQLEQERTRSDGLLLNMLPGAIVERLKTSSGGRIAQSFDQVSVFFADAVGSTEQAARSSPEAFADALDALFRHFDEIAMRHGLEKIKTIGDAYMAVAGAPTPMADHADAAVGMAVDILTNAGEITWPSGDPIVVRGGIATGPAVAGVIGDRRFAYDLWGDAVNLASRLEANAGPGRFLVSESPAGELTDRFDFGPPEILEVKGKGPTTVRVLLGPPANVPIMAPLASEIE